MCFNYHLARKLCHYLYLLKLPTWASSAGSALIETREVAKHVSLGHALLFMCIDTVSLTCLYEQVVQAMAETEAARTGLNNLPSSSKDDGTWVRPPANRFAAALCGVLGTSALGSTLAVALLLSHHPIVCHSAKRAMSLWGGITRRAFGGAEGVDRLLQDPVVARDVAIAIVSAMQGPVLYER